ncbi:MAG: ABC transporter substrate-binding protein [Candidatus Lambdaproteobacteria bacterium]|nr:ABC transporter substrate-binding protein [Candidatus Lambdaproteobacteria bacterium]
MGTRIVWAVTGLWMLLALHPGEASAQKYGGVLKSMLNTNPSSLSLHDESSSETVWSMMPVYSNLALYDPLIGKESIETVIPELAESWSTSADGRSLTFKLKQGVTWHDGRPFSSKDVKHTFDVVRGASTLRTKLNPRKAWYANVEEIVTNGDAEVAFRLKQPQPALIALLASGWSPVYPSHVLPRDLRTGALGTGPFLMKEFRRDHSLVLVKNPNYFVKGRPYMDGINFTVLKSPSSRDAALVAKQIEIFQPNITVKATMDALKKSSSEISFQATPRTLYEAIVFNTRKPPFNNPRLRLAVSLGLDRRAFINSLFKGGMVPGGLNLPAPDGNWGLDSRGLDTLPGFGDPKQNIERARALMTAEGYSAEKPLKVVWKARNVNYLVDSAVWAVDQLRDIWIDAKIQQVELGAWYGVLARRDFSIAMKAHGPGADDPDVNFFEFYACDSQRNYSDYCNRELQQQMNAQSREADQQKRLTMVRELDRRMVEDGAAIVMGFRVSFNAMYPWVKNYIPHQSLYTYHRMQDVWLDR